MCNLVTVPNSQLHLSTFKALFIHNICIDLGILSVFMLTLMGALHMY